MLAIFFLPGRGQPNSTRTGAKIVKNCANINKNDAKTRNPVPIVPDPAIDITFPSSNPIIRKSIPIVANIFIL